MNTIVTIGDFLEAAGLPRSAVPDFLALTQDRMECSRLAANARAEAWAPGRWQAAPLDFGDGLEGVLEMRLPKAALLQRLQKDEGQEEDAAIDPDWLDYVGRNAPQCKVRHVPRKTIVVAPGLPGRVVAKRYN